MNKLRIGIAGTGGMGQTRAKWLSENNNVKIVTFFDVTEKAEETAALYKIPLIKDYQEFLLKTGIDAVVLSVPNRLHSVYAIQALKAGKNVLVEYPMAIAPEEAEEMVELSIKKGLILHAGHTMRFEPLHTAVKQNLSRIGKMIFATGYIWYGRTIYRWYGNPELRGDTFTFLNYHHIDQFRDLFGEAEWVNAVLDDVPGEKGGLARASGTVMLGFKAGGCAFTMQGHGILAPHDVSRCIVGEKGYLEYAGEQKSGSHEKNLFMVTDKGREKIPMADTDPYRKDTDNFIKEMLGEIKMAVPPEEGLRTLRVCKAAFLSAREKQRIYL